MRRSRWRDRTNSLWHTKATGVSNMITSYKHCEQSLPTYYHLIKKVCQVLKISAHHTVKFTCHLLPENRTPCHTNLVAIHTSSTQTSFYDLAILNEWIHKEVFNPLDPSLLEQSNSSGCHTTLLSIMQTFMNHLTTWMILVKTLLKNLRSMNWSSTKWLRK